MYCSVTLSKTKKPRWFRKESPALKNPKIKTGRAIFIHTHKFHGKEEIHHGEHEAKVVGEPITREPRPSYTVKVGESFRDDNGKPKSKQKHINTFSEWDVIDTYLDHQDMRQQAGHWLLYRRITTLIMMFRRLFPMRILIPSGSWCRLRLSRLRGGSLPSSRRPMNTSGG